MSITRNRYFLAGILLILLGIQFRMIDSFVLKEPADESAGPIRQDQAGGRQKLLRHVVNVVAVLSETGRTEEPDSSRRDGWDWQ